MAGINGTEDVIPTLQNMTSVRIAIELWKLTDVKNAIEDNSWKFYVQRIDSLDSNAYIILEDSVRSKISNLLPKSFERNFFHVIRHTGLQICEWADVIIKTLPDVQLNEFLNTTVWCCNGTIDRFKSVHYWLRMCEDSSLFPLACCFCFETEITRMWNLMTDSIKHYYCNEFISQYDPISIDYWTYTLRGKYSEFKMKLEVYFESILLRNYLGGFHVENPSDNALMMLVITRTGSFPAVKYFTSKLEDEERSHIIEYCLEIAITCEKDYEEISCYDYFDMTYFLLHQTSYDQQKRFLQRYKNFYILMMVEHWSYQRFIVVTLTQMWEFLSTDIYCSLLAIILGKIISGKYVTQFLLENIWYVTPLSLKTDIYRYVLLHTEYLFMFENYSVPVMQTILGVLNTTESNEVLSFLEI